MEFKLFQSIFCDNFKEGAKAVCKKILEEANEMWQGDSDYFSDLEGIIKDLGVEV